MDTTGCKVTTTTISEEQLREASQRVRSANASPDVTLLNKDWRDLNGRFDRVISIEMIEAVDWRDYNRYFATIEQCMQPDGVAAIQAICVPDRRYERTKNTEDFIRRFIFPGGFLPSIGAIAKSVAATQMQIVDVEDITAHYAETLRRWRARFDERIDEVKALGLDDRFCRLWRFYPRVLRGRVHGTPLHREPDRVCRPQVAIHWTRAPLDSSFGPAGVAAWPRDRGGHSPHHHPAAGW